MQTWGNVGGSLEGNRKLRRDRNNRSRLSEKLRESRVRESEDGRVENGELTRGRKRRRTWLLRGQWKIKSREERAFLFVEQPKELKPIWSNSVSLDSTRVRSSQSAYVCLQSGRKAQAKSQFAEVRERYDTMVRHHAP